MCKPAAEEMKFDINLAFCVVVVLTGSSRGQSRAPPAFTADTNQAETSASPDLTEDPGNELPQRRGSPETSAEPTTSADAGFNTHQVTSSSTSQHTPISTPASSHSAATDQLSSTQTHLNTTPHQTEAGALPTSSSSGTVSSQSLHTVRDASSTVPTLTTLPGTTSQTLASDQIPAAPTHEEVPSQLKVGDEDLKGSHRHSSSPLDPLLAGLLSVFIVTTAIVFIVLFLKFRQRTDNPEFHRLQDLPMDDLMEDTPLSRYTY